MENGNVAVRLAQAAYELGISLGTARRRAASGDLPAFKMYGGPHGHWRMLRSELEAVKRQKATERPAESTEGTADAGA
jgi:hypothetical protein